MTGDRREEAARRAMTIALRTATPMLGSREDAGDIAQDVALDVLRSLDRLRDADAFDAWVRKIAVRHTLRAVRKQRLCPLPLAHGVDATADPGIDRDLLIASQAVLARALGALPPRQAVALVLRYVHDLTDREIADALGCRRGTVNALLSRGRATLRDVPALRELAAAREVP